MKTYQYILSAAALILGLSSCSEDALVQNPIIEQTSVEVTLCANFAATRTSMATNGDVLWSATDKIKVQIGDNSYDFDLKSGANTASAVFHAIVTESDASILNGTAQGTVTAYYPTTGTAVPATQTYAEGTFADNMNPMTATYTSGILSFTNNAAVARLQGVSKDATSAVLSYTVGETNYSVTMALTAGQTDKDLYFVIVPGAKDFYLSVDGGATVKYQASETTVAGSRYELELPAIEVATESALRTTISNASAGEKIKLTADITLTSFLEINKPLTINLNGKELSTGIMDGNKNNTDESCYRPIRVGSTVVIKNGSINGPNMEYGNGIINVLDNGNLTLSNVSMNTPGVCATSRTSTSVLTIEGGTYTSTGTTSNANEFCYCTPVAVMNAALANIKGGDFIGTYYAAAIWSSGGTINISGGTFNKGTKQIATNEGNLSYALLNDGNNTIAQKGTITISGNPTIHGSFRGRFNNQAGHYGYLNISGGTFDSDCELFNFNQSYITLSGYTITPNGECPDKGYSTTTGNGKRWILSKSN